MNALFAFEWHTQNKQNGIGWRNSAILLDWEEGGGAGDSFDFVR